MIGLHIEETVPGCLRSICKSISFPGVQIFHDGIAIELLGVQKTKSLSTNISNELWVKNPEPYHILFGCLEDIEKKKHVFSAPEFTTCLTFQS